MARNTSFTRYGQDTFGAYDEEPNDPEFVEYESAPPMEDDYALPEDPMPLFLSQGDDEEPRQRRFGSGGEVLQDRAVVWPRVFKAAMVAASAAAIAFAILTVGNPLALFADAKASLPNVTADQAGAAQTPAPQPATSDAVGQRRPDAGAAGERRCPGCAAGPEGHARRYRARAPVRPAEPEPGATRSSATAAARHLPRLRRQRRQHRLRRHEGSMPTNSRC